MFNFCDQAVTVSERSKDQPRQLKALWLNNNHPSASNCIAQRLKFDIVPCS